MTSRLDERFLFLSFFLLKERKILTIILFNINAFIKKILSIKSG